MQIDFHHAVTYVVARYAGFDDARARTIAHAAQYVDDATNDGVLRFDNKAMYARVASAHSMVDYRNLEELANHQAWIPFHFLPGNEGKEAGENRDGEFRHKIVCRPDSPIAREMVRACVAGHDQPNGLHRLGVTMHVYADTWAHQGFAGIADRVNLVKHIRDEAGAPAHSIASRIKEFFGDKFDAAESKFVGDALPLGHGAALSYPDRPYLKWHYTNGDGAEVERDNPRDFLAATEAMCRAMQRFQLGDPDAAVPGLSAAQRDTLDGMLRGTVDEDGEKRHAAWLQALGNGTLGLPAVQLEYRAKGEGSWKHQAIGDADDEQDRNRRYPYSPAFLESDWKRFHDALIAHRFEVLYRILPRYGICAA